MPVYRPVIEEIMRRNGGHASLQLLYREFEKVAGGMKITGKTPLNSLRREVQREEFFTRIGLGVYALKDAQLPTAPKTANQKEKAERRHSDIQGMLLEIGNSRTECADTYTPDRKEIFNHMLLGSIATIAEIPKFTYADIIKSVRFADVIWMNGRGFPNSVFEVEHSTNFLSAFTKFCELQDFNAKFYCVAEEKREDKFRRELNKSAFDAIKARCEFLSYEKIENDYNIAQQKTYI
ncbi:MAG: hypothetical protein ACR2P5_00455 [Gammaproteobacteria bacterium]